MTRTPERGPQCRVLPGKSSRTKLLARSQPAPSPPDLSLSIQMPWYLQVKVLGPKALGTGWSPPCSCCCRGPGQRLLFWGPPSPFLVRCWFLSSPCTAHAAQVPCHMHTRAHIHTHIHGTDAHRHMCTNTQHRCAKCIHARTHMHTHAQHRCTQHTQTCIHIHMAMHTCVCAQRHSQGAGTTPGVPGMPGLASRGRSRGCSAGLSAHSSLAGELGTSSRWARRPLAKRLRNERTTSRGKIQE